MLTIHANPVEAPLILRYGNVKPGQILKVLNNDHNRQIKRMPQPTNVYRMKTTCGGWVIIQSKYENEATTGYFAEAEKINPNLEVEIFDSILTLNQL